VSKLGAILHLPKRLVLGRPVRSDKAGQTLLPKRLALPIFASDPLSSVAYATQEIFIVLTLAGTAMLILAPWLALGVVFLLVTVVASYRQVVLAYPSGGGDYEVATKNHGQFAGLVVASALLTDYTLTVAVSISAGVDNIISAFTGLNEYRVLMALSLVALLAGMNLRGIRESGRAFAVPMYLFVLGMVTMIVVGLVRTLLGDAPVAESAGYQIEPESGYVGLSGIALLFFALRAFASGCTALTGVEAIANGVPAFRQPKGRNAATVLLIMGGLAASMFAGLTAMALISEVKYTRFTCDLIGFAGNCETDAQRTVISQVAAAVFGGDTSIGFFYLQAATALILILAANTAFNGFPLLGSVLARDSFLPRQLYTRGDKLVYSNGILLLSTGAGLLIWSFEASVTNLIQLYIIGVFTAFSIGQWGMVRHWNRLLRTERDPKGRRRMQRARGINTLGGSLTSVVLVVVIVTKFTRGAYLVLIVMPILFLIMRAISRHYRRLSEELTPDQDVTTLPSRVSAVVLVSKLHKPTLRALNFARATRPDSLTALTVNVDDDETRALQEDWDRLKIPVPLTVIESPYREITRPVLDYVRGIRRDGPRDLVVVFIPEYVVGHWWEQLLHNQSALRLKGRLLFQPGVMVTNVPWQLESSTRLEKDDETRPAVGDLRSGLTDDRGQG
jgi:amino acid transporter